MLPHTVERALETISTNRSRATPQTATTSALVINTMRTHPGTSPSSERKLRDRRPGTEPANMSNLLSGDQEFQRHEPGEEGEDDDGGKDEEDDRHKHEDLSSSAHLEQAATADLARVLCLCSKNIGQGRPSFHGGTEGVDQSRRGWIRDPSGEAFQCFDH